MEQEIEIKQQLAELIKAPERVTQQDIPMLKNFAQLHPYFQPVHLLLAKASVGQDNQNNNFATAALYTNGQLLHNLLYESDHLAEKNFNVVHFSAFWPINNQPETLDEVAIDEVPAETEEKVMAEEEEVFDEISEIDFSAYQQSTNNEPEELSQPEPEHVLSETETAEDNLVLENIVATDFFAFENNFKTEDAQENVVETENNDSQAEISHTGTEPEENVISKYDDDRLPYTFLWWLAKTRKEHEQIFQPYASPKHRSQNQAVKTSNPGRPSELQHQYVENIFHMQSPFNEGESDYSPGHFKKPKKGDEIIENFIKNEPQISPPKPEQLNNENKAKKSAEDHNDLVSETLASIYIEQMLYDKAIETYEKLSLKFPEKSRYFADLIQSIEKKI